MINPTSDKTPNAVKKTRMYYLLFLVTLTFSAQAQITLTGTVKMLLANLLLERAF